jgi:serine/threonine protein phosphatase PrpC
MAIKTISYAASDIGRVRSSNQDSGYAGFNLFFVADGMGGHAGGDIASALVAQRVAQADAIYDSAEKAGEILRETIWQANAVLRESCKEHPELSGMGTTFSGMIIVGDKATIAHIGDSRIYRARDGEVKQITNDHTFVQRLVETGRITAEEALVHPRRSVLMRVLGDMEEFPEIDIETYDVLPGDRWMMCSDGLSGPVPESVMDRLMLSKIDSYEATELLVGEALEFGAPDNVTVVVVDIVNAKNQTDFVPSARFVGSGANDVVIDDRKGRRILKILNPLNLPDIILRRTEDPTDYVPESDEYLEKILRETRTTIRWRYVRQLATVVLVFAAVAAGVIGIYNWSQDRYYVANNDGYVTIYKGIKESLGPLKFSSVYQTTTLKLADLPEYQRYLVERSITATDRKDADRILNELTKTVVNK